MATTNPSGFSTPSLSESTLSSLPSPPLKPSQALQDLFNNPRIQASQLVEFIVAQPNHSSAIYIYDIALEVGFGYFTKALSQTAASHFPKVIDLQTRAGAGLSLIGRLSGSTSHDNVQSAVLTAYTTPTGLAMMAPSFAHLTSASLSSRLVLQVPTVVVVGEDMTLSPSLGSLASVWPLLPENMVVLLSSTPQQAVDFATLSYRFPSSHVVHLFDHHSSCRELGHSITPLAETVGDDLSVADVIQQAGYSFFEYAGDKEASAVIVMLNGPLALAAKALANEGRTGLGVVIVNVLRPWDASALKSVLPSTARVVHVVDEVPHAASQGSLYRDVFGSLWNGVSKVAIRAHRIIPSLIQEFLSKEGAFTSFVEDIAPSSLVHSTQSTHLKNLLLFSLPQTPLATLPNVIENVFLGNIGISARLLTQYDILSKPGGVSASSLLLSPKSEKVDYVPVPLLLPFDSSSNGIVDFLGVLDQSLLKSHSIVKYSKKDSSLLVATSWSREEFISNIPAEVASVIEERSLHVFIINAKHIASKLSGENVSAHNVVQNILVHLAFLRLYLGAAAEEAVVLKLAQNAFGEFVEGISLEKISSHAWAGLEELESISRTPLESDCGPATLKEFQSNAIAVPASLGEADVAHSLLTTWHDAAKHLLFPTAYRHGGDVSARSDEFPHNPALRPEIPDRTYLVTCTVNKRLTPLEYDRNVFHLEFDTSGTGLKYAIGEALGVHGWNDEQEVLDFCKWYDVDPNRLITIPIPGDDDKMHTRTVLQALQQQIDLFGHPPKSFYTDLAAYSTNSVEKYALLFIGSAEGSAMYKKLSEKDTVTFADILMKYTSAKPGIEKLCELVGDIKPRHYSIASAQSVVGDRVDLLVVTVDWLTPTGSPRYGQCTRYLAGLKVGQQVTVSIKPSVMKLPPNPKQPIIMAGLGTGAAPFRAFLQHLAWLAQNGEEIGPVYYYFGSRHQASEYLYGEEIEAFIIDGIVTRAGLAFSRDSSKKVYIQHKMLEDSEALARMLHDDEGVFYLCGPTWPVPDVYEALVNALVKFKGSDPIKAGEYLESLKEEERYVLEVY